MEGDEIASQGAMMSEPRLTGQARRPRYRTADILSAPPEKNHRQAPITTKPPKGGTTNLHHRTAMHEKVCSPGFSRSAFWIREGK
jgi:hypothetical protein